jgi:hypothetical protein
MGMMLVRYQGRVVGFVGATCYSVIGLDREVDRRRVAAVCRIALEVRAQTGHEIGRGLRDGRRA